MFKAMAEESQARNEIALIDGRIQLLKQSLAAGDQVGEQLRQAETELDTLKKRFPRGDSSSFCIFSGLFVLSNISIRLFASNTILVELWGSSDHPFLHQFRRSAVLVWQTCQMLSSSTVPVIGMGVFIIFVWFIQQRMERRAAVILLRTMIAANFFLLAILILSFFRLLSLPLG